MTMFLSLFAAFVFVLFVGWALFFKFPEEYSIRYRIVKFCATERTREEIAQRFYYVMENELDVYLFDLVLAGKLKSRYDLRTRPPVKVYSSL